MLQDKKQVRFWIGISLATFLLGLLFGWLVLGWQVWPVQWTGVLPADLGAAGQDQYLDLIAESYTLNKDVALAQQRLATFPAVEQASLLADVKTRVSRRLHGGGD
jgi:cell division septal protein FtsQ